MYPRDDLITDEAGHELDVFSRILVPVDFSDESRRATRLALDLHGRLGSVVCVFHLSQFDTGDEFRRGLGDGYDEQDLVRDTERRLRAYLEHLRPGSSHDVMVKGYVGQDVHRWLKLVIAELGASMVLMGTHPRHTFFRTLAEKIVKESEIASLIIH